MLQTSSQPSMSSPERVEHFCTLFDSAFLLQGLALHDSLEKHAVPYHLWVVCMDDRTAAVLRRLRLTNVTPLSLSEIETPALERVRPTRTHGEYCWTITPFVCPAILARAVDADRVTYVDADVMFFDNPRVLLDEFERTGCSVLITEHAYAPDYDQTSASGRFCVQFITFTRSGEALRIAAWWQARCIEWCFARFEDGKFGDQKYLDSWPELFGQSVHISSLAARTIAPWNVRYLASLAPLNPVFFHFHGLRRFGAKHIRLYWGYRVGSAAKPIYAEYVRALRGGMRRLRAAGVTIPTPPPLNLRDRLFMWKPRVRARFARL
jgi:hypothetical protein